MSKQRHEPLNVQSSKQLLVNQESSLQLTHSLITIVISATVLYSNFFNNNSIFTVSSIDTVATNCSYTDFLDNKHTDDINIANDIRRDEIFDFRILTKVRNKQDESGVNKLLGWIDGINDAVSKGYLSSLQILITYPDGRSYQGIKLSFDYHDGEISIRTNEGPSLTKMTIYDAKRNIINLARSFNQEFSSKVSQDKKSISLQLGYNKTKQRGYHPPGFRRMTAAEDLIIPSKEYKSCSNVGSMYTGHHSTSIAFSGSGKSDAGDEKSFSTQSSSTTLNEDCGRNDLIDASSPMDTEMKSYKMVQINHDPNRGMTQLLDISLNGRATALPLTLDCKLSYIPGIFKSAFNNQKGFEISSVHKNSFEIHCSCDSDQVSGTMLLCFICRCLQHSYCYGFLPADEPSGPMHLCIKCIAKIKHGGPKKERIVEEFAELAKARSCISMLLYNFTYPFDESKPSNQNTRIEDKFESEKFFNILMKSKNTQLSWKLDREEFNAADFRDHLAAATDDRIKDLVMKFFTPTKLLEKYLSNHKSFIRKLRVSENAGFVILRDLPVGAIEFKHTGFGSEGNISLSSQSGGSRMIEAPPSKKLKTIWPRFDSYHESPNSSGYREESQIWGNKTFCDTKPSQDGPALRRSKRIAEDINNKESRNQRSNKRRISTGSTMSHDTDQETSTASATKKSFGVRRRVNELLNAATDSARPKLAGLSLACRPSPDLDGTFHVDE